MNHDVIGILGGTFDPIHEGHIAIASEVLKSIPCDRIDFIPCYQPPHREQPVASPEDRLAMVKLAIKNHPHFQVNLVEMKRKGISYSVDTLSTLRQQMPHQSLCFILGDDAFAHFNLWRDWQKIAELVHLIIVTRSESVLSQSAWLTALLAQRKTDDKKILQQTPAGKIYFLTMKPIDISATQIRQAILAREKNIHGLSDAVRKYIDQQKIYIPSIE